MKSIFNTTAANVLLAIATALTSVIIARLFGPVVRGEYAAITALVNTVVSVAALGTPAYIARLVAEHDQARNIDQVDVRRATLAVGVISSALAYLLAVLANQKMHVGGLDRTVALALSCYIPLSIVSVILLNISLGQANWKGFNTGRLVYAMVTAAGVLVYYSWGGETVDGLIVCLLIANGLTVATQFVMTRPIARSPTSWATSATRVYRRSGNYAVNSVASVSTGYLDILVLSQLFTPAQVGLWAVARSVAALLAPVNNALSVTVFSAYARREIATAVRFGGILRNFLLFNAASSLLLIAASKAAITSVFGSGFANSVPLVPLALLATIAGAFSDLLEDRLRGGGHPGPVNVSRFVPLVVLGGVLVLKASIATTSQFALCFALAQMARAGIALVFVSRVDAARQGRA